MARRAFAVVDLGFGDAGKGLVTDFLVRHTGATAVVRFNGGSQAAHNVVTADGRHHTFAQFGSGTFVPGVRTLLGPRLVIDPLALFVEQAALLRCGVTDGFARLAIHPDALVATPYHRALNCMREVLRGLARHGSCGVGFGETVRDALEDPKGALRAADLRDPVLLRRKLGRVAERKLAELRAMGAASELESPEVLERITGMFAHFGTLGVVADARAWTDALRAAETVVFEGAQGVLLCERHGFPPHTSWSRCDFHSLEEIVAQSPFDGGVTRIGVLRAYAVRHGPGPFPTEAPELSEGVIAEPHNRENRWQGRVRYGWLDFVLGRHAIAAVGGIDGLAITHLDSFTRVRRPLACDAYRLGQRVVRELPQLSSDAERQALGAELDTAEPQLEPFAFESISEQLGRAVLLTSQGPTAQDVSVLGKI